MRTREDAVYCGEHSILDDGSNRVPCPYDRNQYSSGPFGPGRVPIQHLRCGVVRWRGTGWSVI